MTAQTVELSPELYARLHAEAERQGRTAKEVAHEWLSERLDRNRDAALHTVTTPSPDREQVRAALRAAGLLVEPTPEEIAWAESVDVTLEEVIASLDRSEGKPLSEIILEQRGPKG